MRNNAVVDYDDGGTMTTIELDTISKRYGETTAVDEISLQVSDGEFFTLVGPSGCGKTTTLRLIAGFESQTSGAIRFDGREMTGVPPEERGVGVVFQNYALFPHMTVAKNIAYGLRFTDPPGGVSVGDRVTELLELVDLPGMGDRDPEALSGGQQQRVALARALAPGPDLLLLDEPMSALDAQLREQLRVQIKQIQSELGITTVYVTHDQEEALSISDRVAVLNGGGVEQIATPQTIYREPQTPFVANFIGDNNLFTGTVEQVAAGTARVSVAQTVVHIGVSADHSLTTGDRVTFCIRPEQLQVQTQETTATNQLVASVVESEFLGETTRVHLTWKKQELRLRTTDPLAGEVTVTFAPEHAHIVTVN
ncbi:ABC transporter ATP-binding protein [Natronocalculus amylovorans]|uniref:Molybdate/tungstate import ATP-binding protein WtpC n=2 Tax=Natronocalculus amylovorans TaxID=2917812 RepID=A0AAE3FVF7_9EURY|nr:ABC transporter ATP-binding protein [Natronocalculus amylovorans]